MIGKDQAKQLAITEILRSWNIKGDEPVILEDLTIERDFGRIFFYDSRRHHARPSWETSLAGNAPIIVNKSDGSLLQAGTTQHLGHYIEEYEAQLWNRPLRGNPSCRGELSQQGARWFDSVARFTWRKRWRWAVGDRWSSHTVRLTIFVAIVYRITQWSWLSHAIRNPPEWVYGLSQWIRLLLSALTLLLFSGPFVISGVTAIMYVAFHAIVKPFAWLEKIFKWEFGPTRFLNEEFHSLVDLTPEGRPSKLFVWLLWPLALYQRTIGFILFLIGGVFWLFGQALAWHSQTPRNEKLLHRH